MSASTSRSFKNRTNETTEDLTATTMNVSSGSAVIPTLAENFPPGVDTDKETTTGDDFDGTADDEEKEEEKSPGVPNWLKRKRTRTTTGIPVPIPATKMTTTYAGIGIWDMHPEHENRPRNLPFSTPVNPAAVWEPTPLRTCTTFDDLPAEHEIRWADSIGDYGPHHPWTAGEFDALVDAANGLSGRWQVRFFSRRSVLDDDDGTLTGLVVVRR
jgi:hypothetical protein